MGNIKKLTLEKIHTIIKTLRFMAKEDITKVEWKKDKKDLFVLDWSDTHKSILLNSLYLYKSKDE